MEHESTFSRAILAANPSFAHRLEVSFWDAVCGIGERRGWAVYLNAARKVEHPGKLLVLPAKLEEVAGFLPDLPLERMGKLPAWVSDSELSVLVEWEHRRWSRKTYRPLALAGIIKLAWYVDLLFETFRPAVFFSTNKIDHGCFLYRSAARHYGAKRYFIERSPLDTFWLEPDGMFVESQIWDAFPKRDLELDQVCSGEGTRVIERIVANTGGFRAADIPEFDGAQKLRALPRPLVFLPMDNSLWTGWAQSRHWQGDRDYYPEFRDPTAALNYVADQVKRLGGTLVLKRHPSDVEQYPIAQEYSDTVKEVRGDLGAILELVDVSVCFLTKVAFTSMALGVPTVTLAPNPIAASDCTYHATTKLDAVRAIDAAVRREEFEVRQSKFEILLGWLERKYFLSNPAPPDYSLPNLEDLFDELESSAQGKRAISGAGTMSWDEIKRMVAERRFWPRPQVTHKGELGIFFDVSRLANRRLEHSGISRVTRALFQRFCMQPGVKVQAVLALPRNLAKGEFEEQSLGESAQFREYLGQDYISLDQMRKLAETAPRAVYFSPYDSLPDSELTGKIPRVVLVHDVLHLTRQDLYGSRHASGQIVGVLESIQREDFIATVSEYTRNQTLRTVVPRDESQVRTIPLGVDEAFSRSSGSTLTRRLREFALDNVRYCAVFAQHDPRKNIHTTIAAFRKLIDTGRLQNLRTVLICSQLYEAKLKSQLGLRDADDSWVQLITPDSDEAIAALLSGAEFMVYASIAEGFGLPVLEAMSCGCPVITSSTTSLPEVAGDAALYVDPTDSDSIGSAIDTLASSESLRAQLSERALKRAARFSWSATSESYLAYFREILAYSDVVSSCEGDPLAEGFAEVLGDTQAGFNVDWRPHGSRLVPTGRTVVMGARKLSPVILCEDKATGVHSAVREYDDVDLSRGLGFSVLLRSRARSHATIWLLRGTRAADHEATQIELYLDLNSGTIEKSRVAERAFVESMDAVQFAGGWVLVNVRFAYNDCVTDKVTARVAVRTESLKTSRVEGQGIDSLELGDAVLGHTDTAR